LIIPYLFTGTIVFLYWVLLDTYKQEYNMWERLLTVLYGNGSHNHTSTLLSGIPVIGAIWFLLAMFWCKQVFNYLHTKINVKYIGFVLCQMCVKKKKGGGKLLIISGECSLIILCLNLWI